MERYEIYTSGATRNVSKDYSLLWRQTAKEYLEEKIDTKYDVNVFVPEMYFNYTDNLPMTDKQCNRLFMHRVNGSALMLVNLNHTINSVGTGMELQKAWDLAMAIIGFGNKEVYPWFPDYCDIVFPDETAALHYIANAYLN